MTASEPAIADTPVMTVGNAIYALYSVAKSCDPSATWQTVADQLVVTSNGKPRKLVQLGDTLKNRTWKDEDVEKTTWPGGNISREQYIDFACGLAGSPYYQSDRDREQALQACAIRNARLPLDAGPADVVRPSGIKDWAVLAEQLTDDLESKSLRSSNSTHGKFNGLTPGVSAKLEPLKVAGWELRRSLGVLPAQRELLNNEEKAEKLPEDVLMETAASEAARSLADVRQAAAAARERIVGQDIACGILFQELFGTIYDEAESDRAAKKRRRQNRIRGGVFEAGENREGNEFINEKKLSVDNQNLRRFDEHKPTAPSPLATIWKAGGAGPLRITDAVTYLQENPGVSPQQCAIIAEALLAEDGIFNEGPQTLIDLHETLVAHRAPSSTILLVSKRSTVFFPENPRLRAMRIRALAACGRIDQARAEIDACGDIDHRYWPRDLFSTVLTFLINQGFRSQSDVDRALDLSDWFIEAHHDDESAYELRARILISVNQKEEATTLLRDVILGGDGLDPVWGTFAAPACALLYLDECVPARLDAATCQDALKVAQKTRVFTDPAELRGDRAPFMRRLMYREAQARYRLICQEAQPARSDERSFLNETIEHYARAMRQLGENDPGLDQLQEQYEDLLTRQEAGEDERPLQTPGA